MSSWANIPERGTVLGIQFVLQVSRLLGYQVGYYFLPIIVWFQLFVNSNGRHASIQYLSKLGVLAPHTKWFPSFLLAYQHHLAFAINAYDRIWFAQDRLDLFQIQLSNHELIYELAQKKQGAIIISCHMGSFDIMRSLSRNYQVQVVPIMYGASSKKMLSALQQVNPNYRLDAIFMDEQGPMAAFQIQEAILAGKIVAIMADRIPPQSEHPRIIETPFIGDDAPFNLNPWILAASLRCPVLFAAGIRTGFRKYQVFAEWLANPIESNRRLPHHGLEPIVNKYVQKMESLCHSYPFQWFNFFDFWSKVK